MVVALGSCANPWVVRMKRKMSRRIMRLLYCA
jgi:hypothetical protein